MQWKDYEALIRQDSWLECALALAHSPFDERPLHERIRDIAYVAFRPFSKAHPHWMGVHEWMPLAGEAHKEPAQDGIWQESRPIYVTQINDDAPYAHWLSPSGGEQNCTLAGALRDELRSQRECGRSYKLLGIVMAQIIQIRHHNHHSYSCRVFKCPPDFNLEAWVSGTPTYRKAA